MKYFSMVLLPFFILLACNSNIDKNDSNEIFVKKYFEHFNAHDWQAMANMYVDTADFKDPSFGKTIVKQTRQQTITKYKDLTTIFPNIHDEILNVYTSNKNEIIVEFVSKGTSADGKSFSLPICTIFTIENGKIIKDFTYFDNSQN
jgi:ketosteroid isomerase-like protein